MADTATFSVKRGDTLPPIIAAVKDENGSPLDLTNATAATLRARLLVASPMTPITRSMTFLTPRADGKLSYSWLAGDWNAFRPGSYAVEIELTFADGNVLTVPTEGFLKLVVYGDIR
jgi:hypothetical protein